MSNSNYNNSDAPTIFLRHDSEIRKDARNLPHWRLDGAFYFVTWRLCDSLPQPLIRQWFDDRRAWLASHPEPWDRETAEAYREEFPRRLEKWLDAGYGACHLRDRACARILSDSMHHFDRERYDLASFVIMPNHVHTLFQLRGEWELESVMHTWKSYSAQMINRRLKRSGPLWQTESWDHLLRGPAHLDRCLSYIMQNPGKAGLTSGEYIHFETPGFRHFYESDNTLEQPPSLE